MSMDADTKLEQLPLDSWHRAKGARMVPFAGNEMPVQYEGIIAEHLWTRENAGLFDVSHMGQLLVHGRGADTALEKLLPADLMALGDTKLKYSLLLDDNGGIIDDLMATRRGADFYVVVNGATKYGDIHEFENRLPREVVVDHMKEQALLALQGPRAAEVLEPCPGVGKRVSWRPCVQASASRVDQPIRLHREDRFEIWSAPRYQLAEALTSATQSSRSGSARAIRAAQAGPPLYSHDLDLETAPVMAGLNFAVASAAAGIRVAGRCASSPSSARPGTKARRVRCRRPPAGARRCAGARPRGQ
jgi:aminomethyltransferase